MYLLVGLGNPGTQYQQTRHNIGYIVLDHLLHKGIIQKKDTAWGKAPIEKAIHILGSHQNHQVRLLKPLTYMNNSGSAIRQYVEYYKITHDNVIIVHDDIDLACGSIRSKYGGGHAGHNGLRDTIRELGTKAFHRIRIGVGRPTHPSYPISDFVLGKFSSTEYQCIMQENRHKIIDGLETIIL